MLVHWNDVNPQSGGTFIAPDSVDVVARFFAQLPQGLHPHAHQPLIHQCKQFLDTGDLRTKAGDIIMCHPYMLHTRCVSASSFPNVTQYTLRESRFATPGQQLQQPVRRAALSIQRQRAFDEADEV